MAVSLTSLLALFLVVTLAYGSPSQACERKQRECSQLLASVSQSLAGAMQAVPIDTVSLTRQCKARQGEVRACLEQMRELCPMGRDLDQLSQQLQTNFDSMCGQEILCSLRLQSCNLDVNTTTLIAQAAARSPPDAQLIKDKCSQVTSKSLPCLETLRKECSSVATVTSSISALAASLDSLCGKSSVCRVQVAKCLEAGNDAPDGQDQTKRLCQVQNCVDRELDAECHSMPDIRSMLQNTYGTVDCPNMEGEKSAQQGQGSCPQLMNCMSKMDMSRRRFCSAVVPTMDCIHGLKDTCDVDERSVSFEEVKSQTNEICPVLDNSPREYDRCPAMLKCMRDAELNKKMMQFGTRQPDRQAIDKLSGTLLRSGTWCRYIATMTACLIRSSDSCNYKDDFVEEVRMKHEDLLAVCAGSSVSGRVVLLLIAALVSWFHLDR